MRNQYFIQEHGYYERAAFYEYIHKKYKLIDLFFNKDYMSSSSFPFVVDFKKKILTVCESITCCACAAQANKIITIEEFKEKEN